MTKQQLFNKADDYKKKIQLSHPLSPEESKNLDEYFRIGFTYSSNALEGNTLTILETKILLEDGLTVAGKMIKDCLEALGHSKAYDYMLNAARSEEPITESVIQKLHRLFYGGVDSDNAGKYRDIQVYFSGTDYIPPAPEDVPRLMEHFIQQMEYSKKQFHPIEFAALCHKRLVDIHPFTAGNGQIARFLMNILFIEAGYGIVSISPALRSDYIQAFMASQKPDSPDTDPFVKLIAESVIETEKEYCRLLNIT